MNQLEDPREPTPTPAQARNERVTHVVMVVLSVLVLAALLLPPLI